MSLRRVASLVVVTLLAAMGACARDTTTTPATTTTAITAAPPTTTTTTTAPAATTTTAGAATPAPGSAWSVVLVAKGDTLNLRAGPGVTARVVGHIAPTARTVVATGRVARAGGSPWFEVDSGGQRGWVNAWYLTPASDRSTFAADPRTDALLDRLAATLAARSDLSPLVSRRGLYVAHFDALRRFPPDQLPGLAASPTLRSFGGGGCSPGECPPMTFARAVGDSFTGAWDDADRRLTSDTPIGGGNAALPETVVPVTLANFHYRAVFDPGDDPSFGGLDWSTWYVFVDYEDGHPVVVAMVYDAWVP